MSQSKKHVHELYHEAQRRAKLPQSLTKYNKPKDLLLSAPNNIIFELFNTIIRAVTSEKLLDFVSNNLKQYLDAHWTAKVTQQAVYRIRRDQALDVLAGVSGAPSVSSPSRTKASLDGPNSKSSDKMATRSEECEASATCPDRRVRSPPVDVRENTSKQQAIEKIYKHVMWRIKTGNVTQITSLLIKLVIDYGYKSGGLKAELFDEVYECFKDWRSRKLIKLYAFGCAPANDQKLLLASTTNGDMTNLVANYIDGSDKRQQPDLIRKLALALRDKRKNCIFITNELIDALQSIDTGAIRCAIVVDRLKQYDQMDKIEHYNDKIKPLLISGKLFIVNSLDCVEFAPDPENDSCC